MRRNIFKLGVVYRYTINDDLYAVVCLLDGFGSHVWLKLTGEQDSLTGRCDVKDCAHHFWDRFELVST